MIILLRIAVMLSLVRNWQEKRNECRYFMTDDPELGFKNT